MFYEHVPYDFCGVNASEADLHPNIWMQIELGRPGGKQQKNQNKKISLPTGYPGKSGLNRC